MNLKLMGLQCVIKRSMTLFKSKKSYKRLHSKKVSWVTLLSTTHIVIHKLMNDKELYLILSKYADK